MEKPEGGQKESALDADEAFWERFLWRNKPAPEAKPPIMSILCPCCSEMRNIADETPLAGLENRIREENADPWKRAPGQFIKAAAEGKLRWACDNCIQTGRAIAAQPWTHTFCDWEPYFAFYDAQEICEDCGQPFVFTAQEQHFWYEELKFWVQSWPKQCLPCRAKRRERKREQKAQMEASLKKKKG